MSISLALCDFMSNFSENIFKNVFKDERPTNADFVFLKKL